MKKLALVLAVALPVSGCSSLAADVTPEDLDRLTTDLRAVDNAVQAIDVTKIADPATAHAITDIQAVSPKAVTAADLLARLRRSAVAQGASPGAPATGTSTSPPTSSGTPAPK